MGNEGTGPERPERFEGRYVGTWLSRPISGDEGRQPAGRVPQRHAVGTALDCCRWSEMEVERGQPIEDERSAGLAWKRYEQ